jgi:hypothetical protein
MALDLGKCNLEPYDRLSKTWRHRGEYRGASLGVDSAGVVIEYFCCDPVGRFGSAVAAERAPFHDVPLHFGGARRFLGCPGCGRRCRILYFGADRLRCRLCLDLRYASQNMQRGDRALAQAAKIARRVDPQTADIDELADKPSRMRWKTYCYFEERHADQMDRWAAELMARLGFRI